MPISAGKPARCIHVNNWYELSIMTTPDSQRINGQSNGVFVIAPTPFDTDGSLDLDSAKRMCDFFVQAGASGLTILGMMGEAGKLSAEESLQFAQTVLGHLDGALPVVVGVSSAGLDPMARLTDQVMSLGAAGVMVAPTPGLRTDEAIQRYFEQVCVRLAGVPVCLQDYPQALGVHFSAALLTDIFAACPDLVMLKHEDHPGLAKLSRFRALCEEKLNRRVSILTGNGGISLPQELSRGADGAMTGFAFPEMLVEVVRLYQQGAADDAETLFDAYLPMVRHELQPAVGLALRKHVLAQRGVIAHAALRSPAPTLNDQDIQELQALWRRLVRRLAELGRDAPSGSPAG